MKRLISVLLTFICVSIIVTSCVSIPRPPKWYLNPPKSEEALYGTGEAKMKTQTMSKTMADSRARDDIARQVEILVKTAITDYAQEAGEGRNSQAIQFAETVSRQIADVTLKGAKIVKREIGPDGTYYALVEYSVKGLNDVSLDTFERNEAAAWAEFKADKALEKLNQELE